MQVKELMSTHVISIHPEESVSVAARTLTHYNIGLLPVQDETQRLCGVLTDRDIVTRCLAANRTPDTTTVGQIMTASVLTVRADTHVTAAAQLMGRRQVRRLPVVEDGKLCGILSLGDLAGREESAFEATDALAEITENISGG